MSAIHELPLIDIDSHFTEPRDLWLSRAPASLREVAPRVVRKDDGSDLWIVGRDQALSPPGFCVIRPDGSKAVGTFSLAQLDEMTPAASDPVARVRALNELGIARQILYPNVLGFAGASLMRIEDRALRDFCVEAYNDACGEIQRDRRGPPPAAGGAAVLGRARRGARARALPRTARSHRLHDDRRARDLGPAHRSRTRAGTRSGRRSGARPAGELPHRRRGGAGFGGAWPGIGMPEHARGASRHDPRFVANARCIVNLIFSGLLDRFPSLNFVSVESGVGWLPFVLESASIRWTKTAPRPRAAPDGVLPPPDLRVVLVREPRRSRHGSAVSAPTT